MIENPCYLWTLIGMGGDIGLINGNDIWGTMKERIDDMEFVGEGREFSIYILEDEAKVGGRR